MVLLLVDLDATSRIWDIHSVIRPAIFHTAARKVIRTFPLEVRRSLGKAIWELVFHAFVKKSQKTPLSEISLGRRRLKELLDEEA